MTAIQEHINRLRTTIPDDVTLVCVSKYHSEAQIMEAYEMGERDFGENHVQEMVTKYQNLPKDIRWHMLGHLQTNKVRAIIPFVHLIQSVDSLHLLEVIEKEAARINRIVNVLIEVHIAQEETKTGFTPEQLPELSRLLSGMPHIHVAGIMGMATNTDDSVEVQRCFRQIHDLLTKDPFVNIQHPICSMGMSNDYLQAIDHGSTMIRVGTAIFGARTYSTNVAPT